MYCAEDDFMAHLRRVAQYNHGVYPETAKLSSNAKLRTKAYEWQSGTSVPQYKYRHRRPMWQILFGLIYHPLHRPRRRPGQPASDSQRDFDLAIAALGLPKGTVLRQN